MSARVVVRPVVVALQLLIVTTASIGTLLVVSTSAEAEGKPVAASPTLKRILENWKARAKRTKTLHFVSSVRLPVQNAALAAEANEDPASSEEPFGMLFQLEFWFARELRFRSEMAPVKKAWRTLRSRSSFDGTRRAVTRWSDDLAEPTQGDISNGIDETVLDDARLAPVWLMLRPFRRGTHSVQAEHFRLITEQAIRDNHHYVELQRLNEKGVLVETLWVDPARDDVVVYWEQSCPDSDASSNAREYVIHYERDPRWGWVPCLWTLATPEVNRQGDSWTQAIGVTRFAINEELPPQIFAPAFAPGTRVSDETTNEEYLVAADGSKPPAADLKIYKALATKSDFTFDPQPLKSALDRIHQHFKIPVKIDVRAFSEAAIDPEMEVAGRIPGIKLRQLLDRVMGQCVKPVQYHVRGGALVIEPRPRSKKAASTALVPGLAE